MQVRERLAQALVDYGVDVVFGVVGDANLFLVETLTVEHGLPYYSAAHEAGAVMMADGYARVTGRLGVATVTHGPGLTNTVTALTEAVRHGTPMLLLAGDTAPSKRFHLQNIDQRELVRATGARFEEIRSAATAATDTAFAVQTALSERTPVVLNIPADLVSREVETPGPSIAPAARSLLQWSSAPARVAPDSVVLDQALGMMIAARRPVVLAGRGAVRSGARAAILAVAERLGAPVATTLLAKDWFAGTDADLGICGTLSAPEHSEIISKSDCVVAFGAALRPHTTVGGDLLARAAIIHCDLDARAFDRFTAPAVRLLGDAQRTAELIARSLDEVTTPTSSYRAQAAAAASRPSPTQPVTLLDPLAVTLALRDMLPAPRTVVIDAGRFMGLPMRHIPVDDPASFVFTCNFGSIALGTGNAVGAGIGRPDRPAVLFVGDGGFMMGGLGEFNSAVRHGVDLIVVVYNDSAYGAEYIQMERLSLPTGLTEFAWPDFASVARALGGEGITVESAGDLDLAAAAITSRTRPLLIDLRLDPAHMPPVH